MSDSNSYKDNVNAEVQMVVSLAGVQRKDDEFEVSLLRAMWVREKGKNKIFSQKPL